MPKIKLSALATDIKGKSGGSVFSTNSGGTYFRNNPSGGGRKSGKWDAVKNRFGSIASYWKKLTEVQQTAWNQAVQNFPTTNAFGDPRVPSGYELFMRLNTPLLNLGYNILELPPEPSAIPSTPIFELWQPELEQFAPNSGWNAVDESRMINSGGSSIGGASVNDCEQDRDCASYSDMCIDGTCTYVGNGVATPLLDFDKVGRGFVVNMRTKLNDRIVTHNHFKNKFPLISPVDVDGEGLLMELELSEDRTNGRIILSDWDEGSMHPIFSDWFKLDRSNEVNVTYGCNDLGLINPAWSGETFNDAYSVVPSYSVPDRIGFNIPGDVTSFFRDSSRMILFDPATGNFDVVFPSDVEYNAGTDTTQVNASGLDDEFYTAAADPLYVISPTLGGNGSESFTMPTFEQLSILVVNGLPVNIDYPSFIRNYNNALYSHNFIGMSKAKPPDILCTNPYREMLPGTFTDFRLTSVGATMPQIALVNRGYLQGEFQVHYAFSKRDGDLIPNYGTEGNSFDITNQVLNEAFDTSQLVTPIARMVKSLQFNSVPVVFFATNDELDEDWDIIFEITPPISNGRVGSYNNFKRVSFGANAPIVTNFGMSGGSPGACQVDANCGPNNICVLPPDGDPGVCQTLGTNQHDFMMSFLANFGTQPTSGVARFRYYMVNTTTGQATIKTEALMKKGPKFKAGADLSKSVN